jgi:hypothetical protein
MSVKGVGWVAATNVGVAIRSKRMFWMAAKDGMREGPDGYVSVDLQIKVRLTIWNSHGGIFVRRTAQR